MSALLKVPTFELMKLWGELVECYYKKGVREAEIYAYRFIPYTPTAHALGSVVIKSMLQEGAAAALAELVELFAGEFSCNVAIDGRYPDEWREFIADGFDHRAIVAINP